MIRALLILLACFAFVADAKKPPPAPQCNAFGWCNQGVVANDTGSYTPVVPLNATQMRVYANTRDSNNDPATSGDYWLRSCTWTSCGPATKVLDVTVARDTFIRTSGVALGASGTYYAVMYTGDGYPTQGGFSPSWATSPDGVTWTWRGPIGIFGRNQSSAAALIVDESRTDAFACMAWLDIGSNLYLMHAPMPCDPQQWTSDGINQYPFAGEQGQFCSATQTPYGIHMICAKDWPATAHRHIFSCTGFAPWTVLEMDAMTRTSAGKGTNIAYDAATNTIHALTTGQHFTLTALAFPC